MKFILCYEGEIRARGRKSTIENEHAIRKEFHRQLKVLYSQEPFNIHPAAICWNKSDSTDGCNDPETQLYLRMQSTLAGYRFLPFISDKIHLHARLDILFLKPVVKESSIASYFDIDNKVKTLIDAMTIPPNKEKIPTGTKPEVGEDPFLCVLSDDKLVTELNVRTEKWLVDLGQEGRNNTFKVLIEVTINASRGTPFTGELAI